MQLLKIIKTLKRKIIDYLSKFITYLRNVIIVKFKNIRFIYVDTSIAAAMILFFFIYDQLNPKLVMLSSNNELNWEIGQHGNHTCIVSIETLINFKNYRLKPGYIDKVSAEVIGLNADIESNKKYIEIDIVRVDKKKVHFLQSEQIHVNLLIFFKDCHSLEEAVEFKVTFTDNYGNLVYRENQNAEGGFKFKPDLKIKKIQLRNDEYVTYGSKKKY